MDFYLEQQLSTKVSGGKKEIQDIAVLDIENISNSPTCMQLHQYLTK